MSLKMDERLGYLPGDIRALRDKTMTAEWNYGESLSRKLRKLRGHLSPMDIELEEEEQLMHEYRPEKQYTLEEVRALRAEYFSELEKMRDVASSLIEGRKDLSSRFDHSVKLLTEFIEEEKSK